MSPELEAGPPDHEGLLVALVRRHRTRVEVLRSNTSLELEVAISGLEFQALAGHEAGSVGVDGSGAHPLRFSFWKERIVIGLSRGERDCDGCNREKHGFSINVETTVSVESTHMEALLRLRYGYISALIHVVFIPRAWSLMYR
jgi:hypothetical protein